MEPSRPEVRIVRLAAGGDGVGKLGDGRAVFVPRAAPGDLVELQQLQQHRRFARARIGRLLEPGPDRTVPRCPHYIDDDCGGCQLQHVSAPAQLEARRGFVGDALRRLGQLDVTDPEIVPAPEPWEYRTKLTLHVSADARRIGLHRYARPTELFELQWCHITSAHLNTLWRAVRSRRALLPPRLEQVVVRLDRAGGRHVIFRVSGTEAWAGGPALGRELARDGVAVTLWWQPEHGVPRAVAGAGEAYPAAVFEQIHPAMGDRVRAFALAQLGALQGRHVWDLYAGVGETSERLLAAGASVESVEVDARAVAYATAGAESRGVGSGGATPDMVRHTARVEHVVSSLRRPDLVVTNPPRTGMDARVSAALAAGPAARIVYVSCDPATLARDVVRLGSAYRLAGITAFDLFPQTAHVESVAVLDRA